MTANGKVNRRALPHPDAAGPVSDLPFVAPRTPTEEMLAGIWADLLGLEQGQIGIHDDFFALGGHSLLTVRLVAEIRKQFKRSLPLAAIFQGRTIESLAEILSHKTVYSPWSAVVEMQEPTVDLQAEAVLDLDICPEVWPGKLVTEPSRLLLSGATGFLGSFLLAELLAQTAAEIYCLVRAGSVQEGQDKLQRELEATGLWQSRYQGRITPIPGDLTRPYLGLSRQIFEDLAPYQELKAANVLGTREIVRLAAHGRIKPLHYVSTLGVFSQKESAQKKPVREHESIDEHAEHLLGGYAQSKWVAEKLVTLARSRGLPVAIYRPGRITGLQAIARPVRGGSRT